MDARPSEESMEVDDGEEEYCAVVVDKGDLRGLSIPLENEQEGDEDSPTSSKSKRSRLTSAFLGQGPSTSTSTLSGFRAHPNLKQERSASVDTPSSSASSLYSLIKSGTRLRTNSLNPDDDIRKATAQYLQGELSLTDFAAAMEDFGRLDEAEEVETKPDIGQDQYHNRPQPSLVLLNPETVDDVKPTVEERHREEGFRDEDMEETDEALAKLKGEFFRTGTDLTTFSIRRKRKMPPTIKSLMGEAHLRFAKGDLAGAENICMEVIKEQPTYKDPFHTLAMVYESQGRVKKSLQFFLICGLLDPKNFDDWPRLAELSVEDGNRSQAIMCLSKAIVADPTNVKAHIRRSELMAETGDTKGALRGYQKVLQFAEHDGAIFMDVSTKMAGIYFQTNELENAFETLSLALSRFSDRVTTAELNLVIEVCISLKRYVRAVTLFAKYSGVKFEPTLTKESFKDRAVLRKMLNESNRRCIVPIGLHADLIQKLCVVLIHLEAHEMVQPIVDKLRNSETIESFGLQLYEIAEAYIAKQMHKSALSIIFELINTEKFSTAAEIWLRYAECLFLLNRMEDSADAYSKVIQLAPGHKIARLNLSVILQKLGKYDTALESLDQNEMESLIDQDLLVEKCNILLARDRIPEFYDSALQLFSRHCPDIRDDDEVHAIVITSYSNQQLEGLKALRHKRGDPLEDDLFRFEIKPDENPIGEWTVYVNLLKIFLKMNRPDLFRRVSYTCWVSQLFSKNERMQKDLDLHCALASILCGDTEMTPHHLRTLVGRYNIPLVILNLLSLACRRCGHTRYGRTMVRLLMKHPNDTRLMTLSAHTSFMTGTYKYALMEYMALYKLRPEDPINPLMIATTLLHIAAQKQTGNRSQLMVQAVAFITRYAQIRGECQETYYNLGRFYHFQGLFNQAIMYYKKVLMTDPIDDVVGSDMTGNISDLKREAAFNLAQIYSASNCWEIARQYLHRYITV